MGYFAPTSRYGSPDDLRYLIDACHRAGLGVILDWVPGHFPRDSHGLADFDGSPLFEYGDPQKGSQPDWGTLVFNFDRQEVRSFLLSSARFWLEEFHVDGLRVDAVASMLYLDYSRKPGEWSPNVHGGNENLEAVQFLRELNTMTHRDFPGTMTIAEESTAWPGVSRPVETGGLGFSMKWNMGWMHDTLKYLAFDPVHRKHHHDLLTFGPLYAFSENFVLPLSHDEVVHPQGISAGPDAGDDWQRFANLRLAYVFQWTYPGRKLLFMGQEFAQGREWDFAAGLDWPLLDVDFHRGTRTLVRDCNREYRAQPALHERDCIKRTVSLDRGRRCGELGLRVAALRRRRRAARGRHRQFHARAARRLPGRPAIGGPLARDPEYRRHGVRGLGLRQRRWRGRQDRCASRFPCSADVMLPPLGTLWLVHAAAHDCAFARRGTRGIGKECCGQGNVLDPARPFDDGLCSRGGPRQPADGTDRKARQARGLLRRQVADHRFRTFERAQLGHPARRRRDRVQGAQPHPAPAARLELPAAGAQRELRHPAREPGVAADQWYAGTTDAVPDIDIVDGYAPEYLVVLAGDHIYKMDYERMLVQHVNGGADVTVGCIEVPVAEAQAFGVMHVDDTDRIVAFVEKPGTRRKCRTGPDGRWRAWASTSSGATS